MSEDLSPYLGRWPYDPDQTVRTIRGDDGRRKLQVRLPLGVEQYDLDGRPDGLRPHGFPSLLAYWERRHRLYGRRHGSDRGFTISPDECERLREESLLYYYRYVLLFQIGEYGRAARDTARNLRCLDLVGEYGASAADRMSQEQYRPYILRMYRASRALLAMKRHQHEIALREIQAGLEAIENLVPQDTMGFRFEKKRSVQFLRQLRREILRKKPPSLRERLGRRLKRAVRMEQYELAARLRDKLAGLGAQPGPEDLP